MERSFLAVGDKRKEREDLGLVEARMYHQPMFSSSYKSQTSMGVGMPPIRMFPFTAAQWQELQRQALIYKHFMASVKFKKTVQVPKSQDWMKFYAEDLASNRQQWETMHSKIGFKYNSDPVLQTYRHLPNLNYTDNANEDCCSLMKPGLSYLEEGGHHLPEYKEPQKGLIDAWSSDNLISTSKPIESSLNSGRDKLPFSCLTLSMSNGIDEGTDNSPPGGPLAEAFQSTNSNNNCIDLINLVSNSCSSSSSRLVSSPSDVLQKSLVSSDSSSSSPTIAAVPQSEFVFEWMKQNK